MSADYILFVAPATKSNDNLLRMLDTMPSGKRRYAEQLLKVFMLAVE
jgi:hypothetical protein